MLLLALPYQIHTATDHHQLWEHHRAMDPPMVSHFTPYSRGGSPRSEYEYRAPCFLSAENLSSSLIWDMIGPSPSPSFILVLVLVPAIHHHLSCPMRNTLYMDSLESRPKSMNTTLFPPSFHWYDITSTLRLTISPFLYLFCVLPTQSLPLPPPSHRLRFLPRIFPL